jgi:hypothetical protein
MIWVPSGESLPRSRVVREKRLTLAMLGKASPRKPSVAMEAQILGLLDFAGGVAFQAEQGVVAAHAHAVIGHANEAASAGLDFNGQARGLGVQGIFHQFFDHAGRAFDDLAGGDLVGHLLGQQTDAVHLRRAKAPA